MKCAPSDWFHRCESEATKLMFELTEEAYYKVKPLLEGGHLHPEILSIIDRNNPGWIFVDQLVSPKTALVWSKGMQGFYLVGDHSNDTFNRGLDSYITNSIAPRMKELDVNFFEVSAQHDGWKLESLFSLREIHQWEQLVFKLLHVPPVSQDSQMKIVNLRSQEWENPELMNIEFVRRDINQFWSSLDEFRNKGYGFIAIEGLELVAMCYSSFVTEDMHAIGIETLAEHQNKGVGTHIAGLLVKEIKDNGYIPYWDCSLDNEASRKLAIRLGFEQVHQYTCSGFGI